MRDNFTKQTILEIAKGVSWRCSNPECDRPTVAANDAQDGTIIIGDAAHICAASSNGPRNEETQTPEERRAKENGIWLCKVCARAIDRDPAKYTAELLRTWKWNAQKKALREMLTPRVPGPSAESARVEALLAEANRSDTSAGFTDAFTELYAAARADLDTFMRSPVWASSAVELTLTLYDDPSHPPFQVSELPLAVEMAPEVTIIAPPGTGKTNTLLQLGDLVLARNAIIPLFFRLGDWATGSSTLFENVMERRAFRDVKKSNLDLLSERGRLLFLLDGWNEIGADSQRRLRAEIDKIRREFPDVRIVVTTRRQMLDVPVNGPRIEIGQLSEDQQIQIARAGYGADGERTVDNAWREPGLRELIARPLYLSSLLSIASAGSAPVTREGLLRLFVERHERAADHAQALYAVIHGGQQDVLAALAVRMTAGDITTLNDAQARSIVTSTAAELRDRGQFATVPEPADVLDTLTSHHVLVRSSSGAISFQHQQFQEWYASHRVYALMRSSANGEASALRRLRIEVFDQPAWEEAILFAVERLWGEADGSAILVAAITQALTVDPMLAAEMIYRSPATVWDSIKTDIRTFAGRWHELGQADRAARFMIMTGQPDFAPLVWPLASNEDTQVQLPTLRGVPRLRPAVLGPDLRSKVAALAEEPREHLLALIASESGVDGLDLATDLALADPSAKIQAEVVQYLQFRRADRHVARLLMGALDETWVLVARRGYAEEIRDPAVAKRLRAERDKLLRESRNQRERLALLLDEGPTYEKRDEAIAEIIADADFPLRNQNGASTLYFARTRAPGAVIEGLRRRVELGLPLPFDAEDLLQQLPVIDDGPIAAMILDDIADRRDTRHIAILAGPKTVASLFENYLKYAADLKTARSDQALHDKYLRVRNRLGETRHNVFVPAFIAKANETDPVLICALASVICRHGDDDEERRASLQVPASLKDQMINIVRSWVDDVISSPDTKRCHLYPVANAIGRLGYRELLPELKRLLDEDIARLKRAREDFQAVHRRGDVEATSDARMRYGNQYQDALVRIGGDQIVEIAASYLEEPLFSIEAARVLMAIANNQQRTPPLRSLPSFENAAAARAARAGPASTARPSRAESALFEAIDNLGQADKDSESQLLAIRLGGIALLMSHTNRDKEIAALMALPQPLNSKRELLTAMALDGMVLDASLIARAIDDWLLDAAKDERTAWHKRQHTWEIEPWLELLPFSDRPRSIIEAMAKVKSFYGTGHRQNFDRVVQATATAPAESEALLGELIRAHRDIASDYIWTKAILSRDSGSAVLLCLDLVSEGLLGTGPHADSWHLTQQIKPLVERHASLKAELENRYQQIGVGPGRVLLERVLAEIGDGDDIIDIVKSYVATGRKYDGGLAQALRNATVWHEPVPGAATSFYIRPASVAKLRKFLFELIGGTADEAALATHSLVTIDHLRDEHGIAAGDPRHPDIRSGRPWPVELAGG